MNGTVNDLSHISSDILAEVVVSLADVCLCNTRLTPNQVQSIFQKIANCEDLKLTKLNISDNDFSSVPADVLGEAISRLESVDLTETHLTPDQAQSIFDKIANYENLKLTELDIPFNNLSLVPWWWLVEAISRLKHIHLDCTDLTSYQVQSIFHKIEICENLKLTQLGISYNDLSSVPADVLAEAISRLEYICLFSTELTPDQTQSIFHKIANCENLKLTDLGIADNDLSSVPADVLVKAISRLEIVDLKETHLTPYHSLLLIHKIAICESLKLTELIIRDNDLSSVPADVLGEAISRLKKVDLQNSQLVRAQIIAILTLLAERTSTTLRYVNLLDNDVSSVPRELLERAKDKCENLQIDNDSDDDDNSDNSDVY